MSECGATLDVDMILSHSEGEEETDGGEVWGRLFPLGKGFVAQELVKDEYLFGRGEECDYCFETNGGRSNPHFLAFSKIHFRLYRERDKSAPSKYVVFVQDKSSNGTFVGGERIGKNKTRVLNSDDEIALSLKKNKAFIFNDRGSSEAHAQRLPQAFKDTYTLSKQLGRGACGEVRLVFEKETCKKFAVKIISKKTFSVGVSCHMTHT
jgi:serine/threonine-protein kinase Chk2